MKTIKILGTGCSKCKQVEAIVKQVVNEGNYDAEVIKVEDIQEILQYNTMATPVVVIDGVVKLKGHVPSASEVKHLLVEDYSHNSF